MDDTVQLNDMAITLLMHSIKGAVNSFYELYLTIEPTAVPWNGAKIAGIQGGERIHEGINNSHYIVAIEVFPYVGPHLDVGKDRITLEVKMDGVTVKGYEHMEYYALPTNYHSLFRNLYHNATLKCTLIF
ncbi:MAG: DUF3888 domain-containing protein [Clostridiales bacterium]|nr:DUF3888 domain-containing protein [Clostridiales bacterium]